MSIELKLTDVYTNRCIKSTVLNVVSERHEARFVMSLIGHKNEHSIKQYAVKCPESKKKCFKIYLTTLNLRQKFKMFKKPIK